MAYRCRILTVRMFIFHRIANTEANTVDMTNRNYVPVNIGAGGRRQEAGGLQPPNVGKLSKIGHNGADIGLKSGKLCVNNGFFIVQPL